MTAFCLLHGKWHDSSSWDPLAERLRARGHDVVAPDLPFDVPDTTYEQRAQPGIDALSGATDPVVIVGHSLASGYSPLVALARPGSLLVHLCPAPVGPLGRSGAPMRAAREGFPFPPEDADGTSVWQPEAAITAMYPRLPADTARTLAGRLRPAARQVGDHPLDRHPDVPVAWVYAAYDELFEPEWERYVARELLGVEPVEIQTGHFPMVEAPEELADMLSRIARS